LTHCTMAGFFGSRGGRTNAVCWSCGVDFPGVLVSADGVFLEQNGDEGGGGNGDKRSGDAGEGGSEEEGDEYGEAHQVDAGAHDARDEDGVFEVDIDGVEDEDAGHLGPGVDGGDDGHEQDGDDAPGDGDDVEKAHEKAEEEKVADVQDAEDDGAGDSQDKHEEALTEEPLADLLFGYFEGAVKADALFATKEREEELVGVFAFEHEVDAEEDGGEDVEDVGEPFGEGGNEIGGGRGDAAFGALGDGVDAEFVGERKLFDLRDDAGDALGQVGGEAAEVAEDGRQSSGEEGRQEEAGDDDEDDDGDAAGGMVATDSGLPDALDDGHEDDGEEGADVEDLDLFGEGPREGEHEKNGDGEEDVAVDFDTGSLLVWGEFVWWEWGG
jgi:hypothetical protein